MKKICLGLLATAVLVGGFVTVAHVHSRGCDAVPKLDWKNRAETIEKLETCVATERAGDADNYSVGQVHSMLYLAYIYLMDGQYQDIDRANDMLDRARMAMAADCDGWHGENYENYCYIMHYPKDSGEGARFEKLADASVLFQMTMPCLYLDQVLENPASMEYMQPYFGSSRDVEDPQMCPPFDPYEITHITDIIWDDDFYSDIRTVNPQEETEGTIRFGFRQSNYHDMTELLLFPTRVLADKKIDDLTVTVYNYQAGDQIAVHPTALLAAVAAHPKFDAMYNKMRDSIARHYVEFLHMSPDDATHYANLAAAQILMIYVYVS